MKSINNLYIGCGIMSVMGAVTGNESLLVGGILWGIVIGIIHAAVKGVNKARNK